MVLNFRTYKLQHLLCDVDLQQGDGGVLKLTVNVSCKFNKIKLNILQLQELI